MTPRDPATERQIAAADPAASTWLSANAGSGKTRVLIDRVARMLLGGVAPQRILCLTYTKAAASEMQNRLFRRLGQWAMLDEDALRRALEALGLAGPVTADQLRDARRLFARAIETPGGLKIQTIHSFCASLLRRFPLEARVSPQFTEMDDRAAKLLRAEIVGEMADDARVRVVDAVARLTTAEDLAALTGEIVSRRTMFDTPLSRDAALALFDLPAGSGAEDVLAGVFLGDEADLLAATMRHLSAGSANDIKALASLGQVSLSRLDLRDLCILEDVFLNGATAKQPFSAKVGSFPTKAMREALGPLLPRLENLMRRVEAARPVRLALAAAEKTFALHQFAAAFLPDYEARKAARGWLDFDDLILKARALLTDPSVAQWVLFRLDGGIDHILIDEAQDTSPDQWAVIELLAQEFTAGRGARDDKRTIFVVGDKKQSIYSFQGADLAAFDRMRDQFAARLDGAGQALQMQKLEHSFRSSQAVLHLVDQTFVAEAGHGLGGDVLHIANRPDMPGRVDLWPVIDRVESPENVAWYDPVDIVTDQHQDARLAQRIAAEIKAMIASGVQIPLSGGGRPVHEGDFLILVQRRSTLFREIIRACKAAGLAIAGADRLKLGAELAVRDLGALLSFLATPEDDLSLAAALRSPLFGWTEAQLYDLAQPRPVGEFLWATLRKQAVAHPQTLAMLHDLRDQADYLRPYDLIERVLSRHLGRQNLLARLGPEAEDGIDELLSQALAYEQIEVPSLTGFLGWMETDEVEVKRQPDSAGRRIRVMTVHGAKGLEAPIVILPDTADRRLDLRNELFPFGQNRVVWKTGSDQTPRQIAALRDSLKARQNEENMRLLYVAMTRAESWLIVCAAGKMANEGLGQSWYDLVKQGLQRLKGAALPGLTFAPHGFGFGEGLRLAYGTWPGDAAPVQAAEASAASPESWMLTPPPPFPESPPPLAPSALGGAKALPGEGAEDDDEAGKRRGRQLHRLLEFLPLAPDDTWQDLARDLLTGGEDGTDDLGALSLLAEARSVLAAPELAALFARDTLAEVAVTATLPDLGGRVIAGSIDRLLIAPDRVLAVDYKSNALIPQAAEDIPTGILRQMGAYAAALAQIYPDRRVETAILWTRTAQLMPLPHDLVMAALRSTTIP